MAKRCRLGTRCALSDVSVSSKQTEDLMRLFFLGIIFFADPTAFSENIPRIKPPDVRPVQENSPPLQPPQIKIPSLGPKPETVVPSQPSIVTLQQRDKWITVKSSSDGPLYSVRDKKGKVLADNLTDAQLKKKDPRLYKFVKEAIANQGSISSAELSNGLLK